MSRLAYHRHRMTDMKVAIVRNKGLLASERLPRAELDALKQQRVNAVVRHAVARSPFYRERLGDLVPATGPVDLQALPVLTKRQMMDRYDDLVTDPRLKREPLLEWIGAAERDDLYQDEFRVMTTSGSSGLKGLFVYDREAWTWLQGVFLRQAAMVGLGPRLPRRRRIASVHGATPAHMSRQITTSMAMGVQRVRTHPITAPLSQTVPALNAFDPDCLTSYPSMLTRLADEQEAGRLRVSPSVLVSSSELLTGEVATRLEDVFGVRPHNFFACTEGLWGADCTHHDGQHLYEDTTFVENVDADNRPVPPGTPGAKLLVTSLINRVQPLIRLELSDVMVLDDTPCACGRTLVRAQRVEGRADDVLRLRGRDGREVAVVPMEFAVVSRDRAVSEFQVRQAGDALTVRVVPRNGAGGELEDRVRAALLARLRELGADPSVTVERVAELPRNDGGKLQLVVAG